MENIQKLLEDLNIDSVKMKNIIDECNKLSTTKTVNKNDIKKIADMIGIKQSKLLKVMRNGIKPREPIVNTTPKIGRNDKCTCGSGIKYKKCCMFIG